MAVCCVGWVGGSRSGPDFIVATCSCGLSGVCVCRIVATRAPFSCNAGPGPVPRLNGQNIVFGRVLEGMSVVGQVTQVPVFGPSPVGNR